MAQILWREADLKRRKGKKNWLIWETSLPLGAMFTSGHRQMPRAMSGSVHVCVTPVITKGHEEALGLGHHICHVGEQGPCHCRGHPDLSGLCCHPGPWRCPGLSYNLRAISGSTTLLQQEPVLISMASFTIENHTGA